MRKNSILPLVCLLALLGTLCMLIPGAAALTVSAQPKDGRTSTQARVPSAGSGTAPAPAAPSPSPPPTQPARRAQEKPWSPFYDWMKEQRALADENKRNDPDRMRLRKYCSACRKHTEHRETGLTARAGR